MWKKTVYTECDGSLTFTPYMMGLINRGNKPHMMYSVETVEGGVLIKLNFESYMASILREAVSKHALFVTADQGDTTVCILVSSHGNVRVGKAHRNRYDRNNPTIGQCLAYLRAVDNHPEEKRFLSMM